MIRGRGGGRDSDHQRIESVLPEEAARQPSRSEVGQLDRPGMWREAGVRLSSFGLVDVLEGRTAVESKARVAGDARRSLPVRSRRLRSERKKKKELRPVEAAQPNQIWHSGSTKIWAAPAIM
jgi:hypothetical protein